MDPALHRLLQQLLHSRIEDETPATGEDEKEHDLLSFLSIVLKSCDSYNAVAILLGVLLPSDVYPSQSKGAYFEVTIVSPHDILFGDPKEDHPIVLGEGSKALELVALKSPIIVGSRNSPRNRKIWSAMATEFAILKNAHLERHENIVRMLGVCWQPSADTTPIPVLVLEAAHMDMDKFFVQGRPVSLLQLLKLAVQITSGVEAIHAVGVIHGDLKPQNILMFRQGEEWTAKIADFGSSLIRANIKGRIPVEFGSRFWQAPEATRPLLADELELADIFSLGMILWKILSLNSLMTDLEEEAQSRDSSAVEATLEELKQSGELANLALASVRSGLSTVDEPGFDDDDDDYTMAIHLAGIVGLSLSPPYARHNAGFMLSNLHRALDFFEDEDPVDKFFKLLRRRKHLSDSSQVTQLAALEVDQIPNMASNFGTLRVLPRNLYQRIVDELKDVALHSKHDKRRWDAAFEYSLHTLDSVQICQETQATIDEALGLLSLAAVHNIGHSRNSVGWWFAAFGKPNPLPLDEERSWLFDGVMSGSEVASRRLKEIDARHLHSSATYRLRTERAGLGRGIQNYGDMLFYCDTIDEIGIYEKSIEGFAEAALEFAAMTGYQSALTKLLNLRPELDINATGYFQMTPLLKACIAGHLEIVKKLLEHGADPTIAASDGTTPLHYLSSFPEQDIPAAAEALIHAGAPLEARSPDGPSIKPPSDSYMRRSRGTPLSFATSAANLHAVRVLIANGADPFDVAGEAVEPGDGFQNMIHTSPVVLAARNHLPEILEALLSGRTDVARVASFIGPRSTALGTRGKRHTSSCLKWAVDFTTRGLWRRMSANGAQYKEAFIKTFELLVRHGADPLDVDGQQATVLEAAIAHGQPYVVEFLIEWRDGFLVKEANKWMACLVRAVIAQGTIIFNILLQHPPETEPSSISWSEYLVAVCTSSDDVGFLTPLETKLNADTDGTDMLWAAMERSHLAVASWVYARTRVDLTRKKDGSTLLGHLLLFSKTRADARRAVAHFLRLDGLPDSVFFDVGTIMGSSLTALQMAVFYVEYGSGVLMGGSMLRMVLERWDAPAFLNHQVPDGQLRGSTAIMLAALTANSAGLEYLLSEVGDEMDLRLLDAKAYNVYDRAILNLSSQTWHMEVMDIPAQYHELADLAHFDRTLRILKALDKAKLRPNRMRRAIVRTETDVFVGFKFEPELETTPWRFPGGVVPQSVRARDPMFAAMSQLKVDSALYSKRPDPSDDGQEIDAESLAVEPSIVAPGDV